MTIKIGINRFGRIGRMVFRAAVQNLKDIEVVGINNFGWNQRKALVANEVGSAYGK